MFENIKKFFQRGQTPEATPAPENLPPAPPAPDLPRFYESLCVSGLSSNELRKSAIPDDRLLSVWGRFKDSAGREYTAVCNPYRNRLCDVVFSSKDVSGSELLSAAQKFSELAGGGKCGEVRQRDDENYLIISLRGRDHTQVTIADMLEHIAGDPPATRAERRKISRMKRTAAGREAAAHIASGEFTGLSLPFVYYREITEPVLQKSGLPREKVREDSRAPK